jgi:diguanylate cyclase (GGDEF)-like protein
VSRLIGGNNIRDCDVLARWGGEEFILMLPGCEAETGQATAERLRMIVSRTAFDGVGNVTCSFGVAAYAEGDTATTLIARADHALYRAKVNGRNRVEIADQPAQAQPDLPSVA